MFSQLVGAVQKANKRCAIERRQGNGIGRSYYYYDGQEEQKQEPVQKSRRKSNGAISKQSYSLSCSIQLCPPKSTKHITQFMHDEREQNDSYIAFMCATDAVPATPPPRAVNTGGEGR